MNITIDAWKSAIGLFHSHSKMKNVKKFNSNGKHEWAFLYKENANIKVLAMCMKFIALSLIIQLLLICGGIHPNPGPEYTDLSVCHTNIRSIKSRDKNRYLYKLMHVKNELANNFDIITLSETWLKKSDKSSLFTIKNYQRPFRRDRELNNGPIGYGGILAWVCNTVACKRRRDLELPNIEAMWLEIRTKNNKFFLCVAYRPPTKHDFWDILQENIYMVNQNAGTKIMLVGDLNTDPNINKGQKLNEFVYANDLAIHITQPTRVCQSSQTVLDQIISNFPQMVKHVSISERPISLNDHSTVSANLLFRKRKIKSYKRTMWDFKNANFNTFRQAIENFNWDKCFEKEDIDMATEQWTTNLLSLAKSTIPNKTVTVRPYDKPWYNNDLRRLCRSKNKLHTKAKLCKTAEAWRLFRKTRNQYIRETSKSKLNYEQHKFASLIHERNHPKQWWSIAKQINKSSDSFENIPPLEIGDDIVTDDLAKATAFNAFFLSASNLDDSQAELPDSINVFMGGLENIHVTFTDICDQISCLNTSKSYGPDLVSPRFLKEGGEKLSHSLTKLINMSLKLCKVPKLWKHANVTPIHKKESPSLCTNYRPISLLSVVGKIMEKVVFKYVFNHFKDNFIISLFQSGFIPGMSTVTQLIEMYHAFSKTVDDGKEIRVVFLDITKAFDRVWHKGLIYKLQKCGIKGPLLLWFVDYLNERTQRVVINGQTSDWGTINAGVPQGSVLGPLLFLIYINDITNIVRNCHIRLFADDTCLFIEVDNRRETANCVNDDLNAIATWSNQWLVSFSATKTKSLTISHKKDSFQNPALKFMGKPIEEVSSHTYLGLRFSKDLKWKAHISDIALKTRKKLNIMMPMKMKVDRTSLETMYRYFVQPSMEYANVVWGGSYDTDILKLENIHIDAMRLITGATARSNIQNLHYELGAYTVK